MTLDSLYQITVFFYGEARLWNNYKFPERDRDAYKLENRTIYQYICHFEKWRCICWLPCSLILGPNGRTGVFEVTTSQNLRHYLSICSIDIIQINNANYNDAVIYLPQPVPASADCCTDCGAAIRALLPVGTPNVSIITNTQTPYVGTVIKNEYGMIVLAN